MIVIRDAVYIESARGYTKCVLHRKTVGGHTSYYLVETKVYLDILPKDYDVMTMSEIVAKYGNDAVDDGADKEA